MSKKRRVFIVVKTYPTLSKKYDELVCTAGILDDGSWIRIYPLPFRALDYESRYKKYQWIELSLIKNTSDPRPESFRVIDPEAIILGQFVDTDRDRTWKTRKSILFEKNPIYRNLTDLIIKANANELSLAIFKPTKIISFIVEKVEREWNEDCLAHLKERSKQFSLFDLQQEEEVQKEFALKKVKAKYFDEFLTKDIHLFLGTTRQFHGWASNPFVIIGVFYPPINSSPEQLSIF